MLTAAGFSNGLEVIRRFVKFTLYMETSNPLLKKAIDFSLERDQPAYMTLQGVVNKTGILLILCFAAGAFSWMNPELAGPLMIAGLIGGLVSCLVGTFKPTASPIAAPIYAIFEGLFLGAISQIIETKFHGIVLNAMLLTSAVMAIMLLTYTLRIIRVTDRLVRGVFIATLSVAAVYLVDIVMNMFGAHVPYIHDSGPVGIIISLVIVGIAAFNLLVDFAMVESYIRSQAPKFMEWYCGMALLVTLVWLYLEILRLLSKMRSR
jgi:uncharacterized YccA/Bax inhibitor family protein